MAELVDALASGASDRKVVEVQVLFWAPEYLYIPTTYTFLCFRLSHNRSTKSVFRQVSGKKTHTVLHYSMNLTGLIFDKILDNPLTPLIYGF